MKSAVAREPLHSASTWIVCIVLLFCPDVLLAQEWQWTTENVDSVGEYLSMAADKAGNIHISYYSDGRLKYGFRPAHPSRWFTMAIPGAPSNGYTSTPTGLALDPQGNPHICFTPGVFEYASFDGKRWSVQQIDPGSGLIEFNCSVAIALDNTQHVSWYQYSLPGVPFYNHIKHAFLKNGVWTARTIDFEQQTGKWSSLAVDPQGTIRMSYNSFVLGKLKYAIFDGKAWKISVVDSRDMGSQASYSCCLGDNIVVNREGRAQISYEYDDAVLYAWQTATGWKVETIDRIKTTGSAAGFRTRQALDLDGNPHVVYDDNGSVKHAFWDGKHWQIQVISGSGPERDRFSDIAIDQEGTIYIGYRDAADGSLQVRVGRSTKAQTQTSLPLTQTER
jgi:hypothetical protein